MTLVLNLNDSVYKTLQANVKDFNLQAFDMNCEPVSIPDYVYFLIKQSNAEYLKAKDKK